MELLHEADNDKEIDREREVIAAGAGVDVRCEVVLVLKDDGGYKMCLLGMHLPSASSPQPSQNSSPQSSPPNLKM